MTPHDTHKHPQTPTPTPTPTPTHTHTLCQLCARLSCLPCLDCDMNSHSWTLHCCLIDGCYSQVFANASDWLPECVLSVERMRLAWLKSLALWPSVCVCVCVCAVDCRAQHSWEDWYLWRCVIVCPPCLPVSPSHHCCYQLPICVWMTISWVSSGMSPTHCACGCVCVCVSLCDR